MRQLIIPVVRVFSIATVGITFTFIFNNVLIFWFDWLGMLAYLGYWGILGLAPPAYQLGGIETLQGVLQTLSYAAAVGLPVLWVIFYPHISVRDDAQRLSNLAAFIIRAAFWSVMLIGLVDMVISLLRVENLLPYVVGESLSSDLGRASFRGAWVHYPLMLLSLLVAWRVRGLGFIWLGLMVVLAEFAIVVSRFVFSYEQAYMGDLVRFWYAALFLFASAYALSHEGHVRVDVLYARLQKRAKAWVNLLGSLLLGIPLCWIILITGMWSKSASLNSPLISYEISQSGYGLYIKYLMAGFMVVFAVSMIVQLCSYVLSSAADLASEPQPLDDQCPRQGC